MPLTPLSSQINLTGKRQESFQVHKLMSDPGRPSYKFWMIIINLENIIEFENTNSKA